MNTTNTPTVRQPWRYCRQATAISAAPELPPLRSILTGDALAWLRRLPDASIDCVITSPPYHLLRNYDAGEQELGTETDVNAYVDRLADICDEIARILTPTGGLWLNLGDSFSRGARYGALAKSLLLVPDRVLLALLDRGWRVRNKVVWAKTNPTPNSVRDRFSTTWEPMYFLVRSRRYYFDLDAVREPHRTIRRPGPIKLNPKYGGDRPPWAGPLAGRNDGLERTRAEGRAGHPLGKNPGDVWRLATAGYRGAHFAVWPEQLVLRPLIAGCPERVCTNCGRPWNRERRRDRLGSLEPACHCTTGWRPGRVLDPFMGSGTVAIVAERHDRDWLGIELNPTYVAMARARIARVHKNTRNERSTP